MPTDVPRALADLARAFRAHGVRWYVFGAQAVIAAGVPRATADIDVTAAVSTSALPRVLDTLRRDFALRDIGDVDTFIAHTRVVPLLHRRTNLPIDLVLAGPGIEDDMLGRARLRKVGRVQVPFIEINDLLVLKVLAGRPKDLADIEGVLRIAPAGLELAAVQERLSTLGAMIDDSTLLGTWNELVRAAKKAGRPAKGLRSTQKHRVPHS